MLGTTVGVIKGDTRSLDNGSFPINHQQVFCSTPIVSKRLAAAMRMPLLHIPLPEH